MIQSKDFRFKIVPGLVLLLTFCLPLLHFDISRRYNYRIAIHEFIILVIALLIYKRDFIASIPIRSFNFKLVLAFLTSALISTFLSPDMELSIHRYLSIVSWLAYFWLIVYLLRRSDLNPEILVVTLASSCIPSIALILVSNHYSSGNEGLMDTFTRLDLYSNIRHFGYHLTAATLLSFFLLIRRPMHWYTLASGLLLALVNFIALVVSGSRQGVIVCVLFSAIIFFLSYKQNLLKFLFFFTGVLLLVSFIMILGGGKEALDILYDRFNFTADINRFSSGRVDIWMGSLDVFKESWLFGYGAEAYILLREKIGVAQFVQPHSIIIQSLLEWGVIGSLFYFTIITKVYLNFYQQLFQKDQIYSNMTQFIAFFVLLALLVNSFIDGTYYHVLPIYITSIMAAILTLHSLPNQSNSKN